VHSVYQPTANTLYRIESVAFGSFLSLTAVDEGEVPKLVGKQNAQKQYWKFIDTTAKNTYTIVNAAPNPEDIDTHYALNVSSPSNSVVVKDADTTKASVWKIAISADREHCSIITSYPGQPASKPHLQANAGGKVGIAADDHNNNQKWRLIQAGTTNEPKTDSGPSKVPQRMLDIPNGLYRVRNILVRRIAFIGPKGYPCAIFDTDKTPFEFRYENSNSPYFSMKVSGTNNYVGEINGIVNGSDPSPFLWYLDKSPAFKDSYFICPKASGKRRSWSGKMTEIAGAGNVFNTVPEIMQGKLEGHADLDANCWQRWWITAA